MGRLGGLKGAVFEGSEGYRQAGRNEWLAPDELHKPGEDLAPKRAECRSECVCVWECM